MICYLEVQFLQEPLRVRHLHALHQLYNSFDPRCGARLTDAVIGSGCFTRSCLQECGFSCSGAVILVLCVGFAGLLGSVFVGFGLLVFHSPCFAFVTSFIISLLRILTLLEDKNRLDQQ